MRRLLAIAALVAAIAGGCLVACIGSAAPAAAQNSVCPTAPLGDNSNKCASTQFVQGTLASGLPLTENYVYIGNGSNLATGSPVTGDCVFAYSGGDAVARCIGSSSNGQILVNSSGAIGGESEITPAQCPPGTASAIGCLEIPTGGPLSISAGAVAFNYDSHFTTTSGSLALANIATSSVLGNFSGSNAEPSAQTVPSCAGDALHALANPSAGGFTCEQLLPTATRVGDVIYWNGSAWTNFPGNNSGTQVLEENASGALAWATITGTGTVTQVICGNVTITTSGYCPAMAPQGRLTLTANTPVMTASATGQTTLRYDCYHGGNLVPVYNGTNDIVLAIGSCEITDAMESSGTGVLSSTNVFDIWAVDVSGTLTLCVATNGSGGGWASDTGGSNTARGTGYSELDAITRPYITNKNALSDCYNGSTNEGSISANEATYLGTFFTSGAGTTQYVFPTIASTPVAGTFLLWNYYNRVNVSGTVGDSTSSWTYGSTTIREIHGDTTAIVEYVIGVAEDAEIATSIEVINAGSAGFAGGGIGHNSTSAYSGVTGAGPSASQWGNSIGNFSTIDLGLNYVAQLESVNAADSQTFYGANGAGGNGTGMTFSGRF